MPRCNLSRCLETTARQVFTPPQTHIDSFFFPSASFSPFSSSSSFFSFSPYYSSSSTSEFLPLSQGPSLGDLLRWSQGAAGLTLQRWRTDGHDLGERSPRQPLGEPDSLTGTNLEPGFPPSWAWRVPSSFSFLSFFLSFWKTQRKTHWVADLTGLDCTHGWPAIKVN